MQSKLPLTTISRLSESIRNLVITPEHAATGKMGGIGSYCADVDAISKNTLFLLVDDDVSHSPASNIIIFKQLFMELHPELLDDYRDNVNREYFVWIVVQWLVEYFPNLQNIDIYEYSGIGARVAEAARSGLLPESIGVRVYCHGGHIQLERATGEWGGTSSVRVNNFERSCIQNSNEIWFASDYLKKLYINSGIEIDEGRVYKLGYPYHLTSRENDSSDWSEVTSLVFIGRLNRLKGFEVFVSVVENILKSDSQKGKIKKVYVIGKDSGEMPDKRERLASLCQDYNIEYTQQQMSRQEVQTFEEENAHSAVFILPYFSDNYSIAVLELIERGAPVFCLRTGGTPELISVEEWQNRLASDEARLSKIVADAIDCSPAKRRQDSKRIREAFIEQQNDINKANEDRIGKRAQAHFVSSKCQILDIKIGRDIASSGDILPLDDSLTKLETPRGYAFLHIDGCSGLTDDNRGILENAARIEHGSIYSCGYRTAEKVVIPEYSDLASLYLEVDSFISPTLLIPIDLLNDFQAAYQGEKDGTIDRTPEYFMLCLQFFLIYNGYSIIPIPMPLVTIKTHRHILAPNEAVFASLAAYTTKKNWQLYRYGALLRSINGQNYYESAAAAGGKPESDAAGFDKMRLRQMLRLTAQRVIEITRNKLK